MDDIFFSIIMPCYNSEAYVSMAIKTILNQTFNHFELIVVNDGSTDNTLKLIEKFKQNDKRIKVLSKNNGGYTSAVNFGLNYVSGKYVLMMGSDDGLKNYLLSSIFEKITEYNFDIILFRSLIVMNDEIIKIDPLCNFDQDYCFYNTSFSDLVSSNRSYLGLLYERDTSRCFKTSLISNIRYRGKYGVDGDAVFSLMIERKCRSFLFLPIDGYLWNVRDGSVSNSNQSFFLLKDRIDCWLYYFNTIKKNYGSICEQEKNILYRTGTLMEMFIDSKGSKISKILFWIKASVLVRKFIKTFCLDKNRLLVFSKPILWFSKK